MKAKITKITQIPTKKQSSVSDTPHNPEKIVPSQVATRQERGINLSIAVIVLSLLLIGVSAVFTYVMAQGATKCAVSNPQTSSVSNNIDSNQPATAQQPTTAPTAIPEALLQLQNDPDTKLIGENNNYAVYVLDRKMGNSSDKTAKIIIYDKKNIKTVTMNGTFLSYESAGVHDDNKGEYVLLSTGSYVLSTITPLSLSSKTQPSKEFCSSPQLLIWNDYAIYSNCDTFENRPWGAGEAPSLVARNLITGNEKVIFKSDLTHQYFPEAIFDDTLYYEETSVVEEEDWGVPDKSITTEKTYDLSELKK